MENVFEQIITQFNTREFAIFIWGISFLIFILFYKKSLKGKNKDLSFFKKLFIIFLIITVYNSGITYFLISLGLWDITYFKESLYWFLGTSVVMAYNGDNPEKRFIDSLKKLLPPMALFTFIINTYTAPLLIEIIIQPFLLIILFSSRIIDSSHKDKLKIERFIQWLSLIFTTVLIIIFVIGFIEKPETLLNYSKPLHFIYPLLYLTLFYPFLHLLKVLLIYSKIKVKIQIRNGERIKDYGYITCQILKSFNIGLTKLIKFEKENLFLRKESDIKDILIKFNGNYKSRN